MTPLDRLAAVGTSIWIDGLADPEELERLVHTARVTGMTSNPSILRAAMSSARYAPRIAALVGRSPLQIYETLAIEDVRAAADVLARVHARTAGADGYVSLEVAPALAHDADATVAAARDLWHRIDRPNAMIKIPATTAGVEATRRAIADGINVNVTLLFSVERHAEIVDAYLDGLQVRARRGAPLAWIASVASFFVSRVDTAVDALLVGRDDLVGRAAVANARVAFSRAHERFAGGRPQRLLWASTGTKDARYSDVKYVDELAGPGVVNTMPTATLAAFADHGDPCDRLTGSLPTARAELDQLAAAGIDLRAVTDRLLADGVARFAAAMDDLLCGLAAPAAA